MSDFLKLKTELLSLLKGLEIFFKKSWKLLNFWQTPPPELENSNFLIFFLNEPFPNPL